VSAGQLPLLQQMYDEWPFFKGMLDLVEMVMAKADPKVTAMYDAKLVRPELQVRGRVRERVRARKGRRGKKAGGRREEVGEARQKIRSVGVRLGLDNEMQGNVEVALWIVVERVEWGAGCAGDVLVCNPLILLLLLLLVLVLTRVLLPAPLCPQELGDELRAKFAATKAQVSRVDEGGCMGQACVHVCGVAARPRCDASAVTHAPQQRRETQLYRQIMQTSLSYMEQIMIYLQQQQQHGVCCVVSGAFDEQ